MTKIFMLVCLQIDHSFKSLHQECPDFYHILHSRYNINLKTNIGFLRCLNVSSIRIMNCACERITNSGYLNANAVFTFQQYHYSGKYFFIVEKCLSGNKQFNIFGMKMLFHILILVDILMRHCHSYGNEKNFGWVNKEEY